MWQGKYTEYKAIQLEQIFIFCSEHWLIMQLSCSCEAPLQPRPLQLTNSPSCIQVPNHTSTYTCSTLSPHSPAPLSQSPEYWSLRPHSHGCVRMRWFVKGDGSPFTLNGVTSSVAKLNCGSVGFRCAVLLVAKVEKCLTFRVATYASANQIAFHANTTAQALANQIAFMPKSLYLKVVCLTFFCLDFFKVPEK